jgi:hypothetical protein
MERSEKGSGRDSPPLDRFTHQTPQPDTLPMMVTKWLTIV